MFYQKLLIAEADGWDNCWKRRLLDALFLGFSKVSQTLNFSQMQSNGRCPWVVYWHCNIHILRGLLRCSFLAEGQCETP